MSCKKALSLALALFLALSLLPAAALAAEDQPERGVLTYTEHIAPQYEDAHSFSEDLAAVKKDGKWGYIDTDGKVVIPFEYDQAYAFSEGKAIVGTLSSTDDFGDENEHDYVYRYNAGFIDKTGKYTAFRGEDRQGSYVTSTQEIEDCTEYIFHNGYTCLQEDFGMGCAILFDAAGKAVPLAYGGDGWENSISLDRNPVNEGFVICASGYYNLASRSIVEITVDQTKYPGWYVTNYYPFNQGLAGVWIGTWDEQTDAETYDLGFVNTSGVWVIQPFPADSVWISGMNTSFRLFGETGLAMVENREGRFGAIDKTGKTVIPFQYEDLRLVSEGLIPFQENGKYGYLDASDLSVAIPAQYENATGFSDGLAVVYDGTKAFLIDWKGNPVPGADKLKPSVYFWVEDGSRHYQNPEEYVVIEESGKYGYGHIEYLPPLPEKDEMSDWAYEEVTAAIEENLVPVYLQSLYRSNIKRGEFCALTMQAVTEILGVDAEELVQQRTGKALSAWFEEYPFRDTADSDVIAAYALGIVSGRGDGTFDPYATITRQEAAALLTNGAKALGMDTTVITEASYADSGAVANWAKDGVDFVAQIHVMNGDNEGRFVPAGTYSREQSFMTVYKLYQALLETQK